MTTIYVVTQGEYSDYHIDAVFSSLEKADAYRVLSGGCVEEYALDERVGDVLHDRWYAELDLETGEISSSQQSQLLAQPNCRSGEWATHHDYSSQARPKGFIGAESFVSEDHARKLCVEKRQELLRLGIITGG